MHAGARKLDVALTAAKRATLPGIAKLKTSKPKPKPKLAGMLPLNEEIVKSPEAEYARTKDQKLRLKIFLGEQTWLKETVRFFLSKQPHKIIEFDDAFQAASIAFFDCIGRYNPKEGASLRTFSKYRIKGAILDEARKNNRLERRQQQAIKTAKNARNAFEKTHGREPDFDELCRTVKMKPERLLEALNMEGAALPAVPLEKLSKCPANDFKWDGPIMESLWPGWEKHLEISLLRMNEKQKTVFILYYCLGMTGGEAGNTVGVGRLRGIQIARESLEELSQKICRGFRA